jgi:hypothetical protein
LLVFLHPILRWPPPTSRVDSPSIHTHRTSGGRVAAELSSSQAAAATARQHPPSIGAAVHSSSFPAAGKRMLHRHLASVVRWRSSRVAWLRPHSVQCRGAASAPAEPLSAGSTVRASRARLFPANPQKAGRDHAAPMFSTVASSSGGTSGSGGGSKSSSSSSSSSSGSGGGGRSRRSCSPSVRVLACNFTLHLQQVACVVSGAMDDGVVAVEHVAPPARVALPLHPSASRGSLHNTRQPHTPPHGTACPTPTRLYRATTTVAQARRGTLIPGGQVW